MVEFSASTVRTADSELGYFWFAKQMTGLDQAAWGAASSYMTWEEMAECSAAVFVPNDIS